MKRLIKTTTVIMSLMIIAAMSGCGTSDDATGYTVKSASAEKDYPNAKVIQLSANKASVDGKAVETSDYTWHCDPSQVHDEVSGAPAEYYTGTKIETDACAYIDHELYYYPSLPEDGFRKIEYDGEQEWAYYYTDGTNDKYIFGTLPVYGDELPAEMMHTEAEAEVNSVLHIKEPGEYILRGEWNGQILVDLGDEDEISNDENAKVTLILDGADIQCTVAPGIMFRSVYECDYGWDEREEYSEKVNTENAGANLIIADGSENYVLGTNVFRMLKTKYKDDSDTIQKKMRKTDGAVYSYMSMNIGGKGSLTVDSGFEGIDSELHLTVYDGRITVNSQNDGINVNEDNVSVVSFNGGEVTLNSGLGMEGDGVDSNGYIRINGGTVRANGIKVPDSALDSDCGVYYISGSVYIDDKEQEYTEGDIFKETGMNPGQMDKGPEMADDFDIMEFKKKVAELPDTATFDDVMQLLGGNQMPPQGGEPPAKP